MGRNGRCRGAKVPKRFRWSARRQWAALPRRKAPSRECCSARRRPRRERDSIDLFWIHDISSIRWHESPVIISRALTTHQGHWTGIQRIPSSLSVSCAARSLTHSLSRRSLRSLGRPRCRTTPQGAITFFATMISAFNWEMLIAGFIFSLLSMHSARASAIRSLISPVLMHRASHLRSTRSSVSRSGVFAAWAQPFRQECDALAFLPFTHFYFFCPLCKQTISKPLS